MAPRRKWVKLFEDFTANLRIQSKHSSSTDERGSVLNLWESQKRALREIGQGLEQGIHTFNCLKSRQLGVTTLTLAIDVFWLAVHPNLIMCLVTDTDENREANRTLIERYINSVPEGYFGNSFKIVTSNRGRIKFSNGARLDFLVAGTKKKSIAWAEGKGYGAAHLTELAKYGDVEGVKSLEEGFSHLNENSLYIYESTALGNNHWRERWEAGLNDPTQRSFFIGWWSGDTNFVKRDSAVFAKYGLASPNGDEAKMIRIVKQRYDWDITQEQLAWYRWRRDTAGAEQNLLDQNQPSYAEEAFVQTGHSFFPMNLIARDTRKLDDEKRPYRGYRYVVDGDFYSFKLIELEYGVDRKEDIELKVWDEPVANGRYVVGFDPAYGRNDHKDGHAIVIFRCYADKLVQVAEYCTCDVEVKHSAWVLFHLCAAYRNCMAIVEINGPGRMIMTEFDHLRQLLSSELGKDKTAERNWEDAGGQVRWYLYHKPDSPGAGYLANFEATWRTQSELMHQFRGEYYARTFEMRSKNLLRDMSNCIQEDNGSIGAPDSSNLEKKDDLAFAAALACRAWIDWIRREMLAEGLTYEAVTSQEVADNGRTQERVAKNVENIVMSFLKTQQERSLYIPPAQTWREKQGL